MNPEIATAHRRCGDCSEVLPEFWPQGLCANCAFGEVQEPEALPLGPPRAFGEYQLEEELGRGGMGMVYRARHVPLNRTVAIKVLLFNQSASRDAIQRLRAEAVTAAALKHPNIVAVHEVGVQGGRHYLAMDFIAGQNLAQLTSKAQLPNRAAARYVQKIAEAIQHAHERGILHRDLKPANVLVDTADEPHVTDFGLAKRLASDASLTVTGQVLGSPNYMAPEQARGDSKVSAACDIYGLGAVLYHLVTGRAPIHGANVPDTIRRVIEGEPVPPRLLNPGVAPELETICLKCLEKDPVKRYPSAADVAGELRRFLNNEPIQARPLNRIERSFRWASRNRAAATALALLVVVAVASPLVGLKIAHERRKAEEQLYLSNISLGMAAAEANNLRAARLSLAAIDRSPVQRSMRGWEARFLQERCRSSEMIVVGHLSAYPAAVAFSPDDKLIASITEDGRVELWDAALRRRVQFWQAHRPPEKQRPWRPHHSLAFVKNGTQLVTGGADGALTWWDIVTGRPAYTAHLPANVSSLALSQDGATLAAATLFGTVCLFRVSGPAPELQVSWVNEPQVILGVGLLPNGHVLVAAERTLQEWSAAPDAAPKLVRSFPDTADMALAPDAAILASATVDVGIQFWKLPGFEEVLNCSVPGGALAFSSQLLASGGTDGNLSLVDRVSGKMIRVLQGHADEIRSVAFSHDGQSLVSAGCDLSLGLWNMAAVQRPERALKHGTKVQHICFLRDSLHFLTLAREPRANDIGAVAQQSTVKLWHVAGNDALASATLPRGSLHHNALSLTPDERAVAVNDVNVGRLLTLPSLKMNDNPHGVNLAYSANGGVMLALRPREIVRLDSNGTNPIVLGKLDQPNAEFSTLAISPDGSTAVCRTANQGEFYFFDARNPAPPVLAEEHRQSTVQFAFSPDSQLLATASWDTTVGLWEVKTRKNITRLRGHADSVDAVAFSPDGLTLASGAQDGTVRLWHVRTRRQMAQIKVPERGVTALAFSPDGQWLVAGGFNGALHLWRAPRTEPE